MDIEYVWALMKDEIYKPEEVSNCCSEPISPPESDICSKCGEHCEIIIL